MTGETYRIAVAVSDGSGKKIAEVVQEGVVVEDGAIATFAGEKFPATLTILFTKEATP